MERLNDNDMATLDALGEDIVPPEGLLVRVGSSLFERIRRFEQERASGAGESAWEAVVAQDHPAPEILMDRAEHALFDKIGKADARATRVFPLPLLFSSTALALVKNKMVSGTLIAVVLAAGAFGWWYWNTRNSELATTVATLKGSARLAVHAVHESDVVCAAPGQRLVISNDRGTVAVENCASVLIRKARPNHVEYAVDFPELAPASPCRAVFSVTKKKPGQEYSVATKDYMIHVVGTVFRITPQQQGRTATEVLEGTVRIEGAGIAANVGAGTVFEFNSATGAYATAVPDIGRTTGIAAPADTVAWKKPEPQNRHQKSTAPVARQPRDSLLESAVRLETADWKRAVECYRAVLARPGSSSASREIALFSIGRLLADHGAEAADIRGTFNDYLKEFPGGSFAGESYLRLADLEYKTDPGRSLVWYEKYLKEFPSTQNTAAAEYKAGLILLQQNKRDRAVAMLSSALRHAGNYPADQVTAIERTLDNAKNPRSDSIRNGSVKLH
jgi:FecR protein